MKNNKLELLTQKQIDVIEDVLTFISSTGKGISISNLIDEFQTQIMFKNGQEAVFDSKRKEVKKQVVGKKKVVKKDKKK